MPVLDGRNWKKCELLSNIKFLITGHNEKFKALFKIQALNIFKFADSSEAAFKEFDKTEEIIDDT